MTKLLSKVCNTYPAHRTHPVKGDIVIVAWSEILIQKIITHPGKSPTSRSEILMQDKNNYKGQRFFIFFSRTDSDMDRDTHPGRRYAHRFILIHTQTHPHKECLL